MKPQPSIDTTIFEEFDEKQLFQLAESRNIPPSVSGKAVTATTLKNLLTHAASLEAGAVFDLLTAEKAREYSPVCNSKTGRYPYFWMTKYEYQHRSDTREIQARAIRYFVNEATALSEKDMQKALMVAEIPLFIHELTQLTLNLESAVLDPCNTNPKLFGKEMRELKAKLVEADEYLTLLNPETALAAQLRKAISLGQREKIAAYESID